MNLSGSGWIFCADERENSMTLNCWKFNGGKSKRWRICAIALLSFAAGSLLTARLAHMTQVRADSNRVFELRVYHAVPGKLPALESRFRDTASKLLAKHDLKAVGYWVPEDAPASDNTFIYILAHPSREEAKKNWDAMFAARDGEIRAGRQAGGQSGRDLHASDGFFTREVAPDSAGFVGQIIAIVVDMAREELVRLLFCLTP
jgi:hypothetical protein